MGTKDLKDEILKIEIYYKLLDHIFINIQIKIE